MASLLTHTLALALLFINASSGLRQHGEFCSGSNRENDQNLCDTSKYLKCINRTCECNPESYVFQDDGYILGLYGTAGCRLKVGVPCNGAGVPCVKNSECNAKCICDVGFRNSSRGECIEIWVKEEDVYAVSNSDPLTSSKCNSWYCSITEWLPFRSSAIEEDVIN